jgi:hypothetical protein
MRGGATLRAAKGTSFGRPQKQVVPLPTVTNPNLLRCVLTLHGAEAKWS